MIFRKDDRPRSEERLKFYEAARAEMVQRLAIRDQLLIAYIATIGGYFAFVMRYVETAPAYEFIARESLASAALPVICFAFSFVILQHHTVISQMATHIREDLYPARAGIPRHWDNSNIVNPSLNRLKARELAQGMILVLPGAFFFVYILRNTSIAMAHTDAAAIYVSVASFDFIMLYFTARLHLTAYETRKFFRRSPDEVGASALLGKG